MSICYNCILYAPLFSLSSKIFHRSIYYNKIYDILRFCKIYSKL